MTVASAIRLRLLAISAVTTIVGQRVHTFEVPQSGTFPAVRVQRVDEDEPMHLRGSAGLKRARVQVDSIAMEASGVDKYADAAALDAAVHGPGDGSALCGWHGAVGSPAFEITGVLPIDVRERYDAEEQRLVKIERDYWVFHKG